MGQLTSNKKYKHMDKLIRSTFDDTTKIDEELEDASNDPSEFCAEDEADSFDSGNDGFYAR